MQIDHIFVDNFKSLVDFGTPLAKFSCLIGLNGAGKSTVLQFVDFLAQQVRGDIGGWLKERGWRGADLCSRLSARPEIDFNIAFHPEGGARPARWSATFDTASLRCTREFIEAPPNGLRVDGRQFKIGFLGADQTESQDWGFGEILFSYQGSVLSQLRESILPPPLLEFKRFFSGVRSFDLLSPRNIRRRAKEPANSIGRGGRHLSAFLHKLGPDVRERLAIQLRRVYPSLESVDTRELSSGSKQLLIKESYGGAPLVTEDRHINDGLLRLLAILAELQQDSHQFLMFDEIENGINPEVVEFLLDALVSAPQQVMVTTHSPVILNYLDDQVARDGVIYLYKTEMGHTRAIPFFDIPSLAEKIKFMGPGEAFVDTDLTALREEITRVAGAP